MEFVYGFIFLNKVFVVVVKVYFYFDVSSVLVIEVEVIIFYVGYKDVVNGVFVV